MATPPPQDQATIARLPFLIGAFACACTLGVPAGFFAAGIMREVQREMGPSNSATLGVVPVALGCVVSLLLLTPRGVRTSRRLGMVVVLSSAARLLFALGAGIVVYFLMSPDPVAYFSALLASSLLCLAIETAWGVGALKKASHQGTPAA